jgi:predicted transposase YbfD/YdcC
VRVLRAGAASAEAVDFPCVEQVALLRRHLRKHSPETVALVTSLRPQELDAAQWLRDNRAAWGIESGLHQRLDVSHLDDQCRVREARSMRVMGMFRRLSNSLFMHWRSRQNKPQYKTTTDFFTAMNAEHHRYAIRCLHARQPSFQTPS